MTESPILLFCSENLVITCISVFTIYPPPKVSHNHYKLMKTMTTYKQNETKEHPALSFRYHTYQTTFHSTKDTAA
jgi:hypothetical protein